MLAEWDRRHPGRVQNIFSSLARVVPSHLMDASLFGFRDLAATGVADAGGDIAFDEEPCRPAEPAAAALRFAEDE
jgi:tRNA 2-thiocytidine biosynthesis protein TtcA